MKRTSVIIRFEILLWLSGWENFLGPQRSRCQRPWELKVMLWGTEWTKFSLGCGKIVADKVIDNLFSSVFLSFQQLRNESFYDCFPSLLGWLNLPGLCALASPCTCDCCVSSILVNWNRSKSLKVDNHKKSCDWFLSSNVCQLSGIEIDQQPSLDPLIDNDVTCSSDYSAPPFVSHSCHDRASNAKRNFEMVHLFKLFTPKL